MKVFVNTHATLLEDDYMNNFKTKSKVNLKETAFIQEQLRVSVETSFIPLLSMQVQIKENILKGEQAHVEQRVQQINV